MDRRMAGYGNRIVAPQSLYPQYNFSYHTPLRTNSSLINQLNDEVQNLTMELESRKTKKREKQLVGSFVNLVNSIAKKEPEKKEKKEKTEKYSRYTPASPDYSQIFQTFQKQQDMMLQFMQRMTVNEEPSNYGRRRNSPKESFNQEYEKVKNNPENVKKILAELNFDDDGAEDYADKEKKLKFSSNLTDEEKFKIVKKLEKAKAERIREQVDRSKGISRFRMIGYVVLFPIFTVSLMIENRAKSSKTNLENMQESIYIFLDVAKSWVLKAIRPVLVSILNDPNLDIVLTNNPSEVKSQTINPKVLKLNVRINGILEGLENLTNEKEMLWPFRNFIDKYTADNSYPPKENFCGFEKSRLEWHEFGGLINQNEDKKKLMIGFFFINKILVKQICMKPVESGLPITRGSKAVL